MISGIDFAEIEYIVELGPGTGVFTEAICHAARPDAKIMAVELESTYIESLEHRYQEDAEVVHASADMLPDLLAQRKWPRVDLIVSGLPFVLPDDVKYRLFSFLQEATSSGTQLRWFTYMPPFMKPHYRAFDIRKHAFVAWNFPPMWIYRVN